MDDYDPVIATDGCFDSDGNFIIGITPNASDLEIPFRCEVLDMLKREGKITDAVVDNMVYGSLIVVRSSGYAP